MIFQYKLSFSFVLTISVFLTIIGCSSTYKHSKGKPLHHTTNGFRNCPIISEDTSKSFAFNYRRIIDSFNLPKVPSGHHLSEEDAITGYNELKSENTITWLGHSTFIIKIDGKTILTDPILTGFASPLGPFGARRFVPAGISLKKFAQYRYIGYIT